MPLRALPQPYPIIMITVKDRAGHEIMFGDGGDIRMPPVPDIPDYRQHLKWIKDLQLRPDDVVVAAYPKSGNNWIHHIVTMLKEGHTHPKTVLGKDDFVFLDGCGGDKRLPPPDKPRTLWSHLPFRYLPRDVTDRKAKVVYFMRNPKDVMVSAFCFAHQFRNPVGYNGTWAEWFSLHVEQGGYWYGDMMQYLLDWDKAIKDHLDLPIFPMYYENLKRDTLAEVEKLNEFLGTNRDREFCQAVVDACRFSNMGTTRVYGAHLAQQLQEWTYDNSPTKFYRKGEIGDWKNWFTVAQNEQYDEAFSEKMADSEFRFTFS